jgi:hypothetical protein
MIVPQQASTKEQTKQLSTFSRKFDKRKTSTIFPAVKIFHISHAANRGRVFNANRRFTSVCVSAIVTAAFHRARAAAA